MALRFITTHHIRELPGVAELVVIAGDPDQFGIPHVYTLAPRGDAPMVAEIRLQSGDPRNGWNGGTTLSYLAALVDFLSSCQRTKFECEENRISINYLEAVIGQLKNRIRRREHEKTMHTHDVGPGEQSAPAPAKSLGQIAYDAYCATTGWKSLISGADLPRFSVMQVEKPAVAAAWEAAAAAVKAAP